MRIDFLDLHLPALSERNPQKLLIIDCQRIYVVVLP